MAGQNPLSNLAAVSLRQIRQLARSLGIFRDSSEEQKGLNEAIKDKISSTNELGQDAINPGTQAAYVAEIDVVETVITSETIEPLATPITDNSLIIEPLTTQSPVIQSYATESSGVKPLVVGSYGPLNGKESSNSSIDSIQDSVSLPPSVSPSTEVVTTLESVAAEIDKTTSDLQTQPLSTIEIEAQLDPVERPEPETRVVFLPRDPQWAFVFWEIADSDRQQALEAGASQLALRLADVTGLQGDSFHPQTLQEVVVDSYATEWYLPMPLSDRDYRVELGYRKKVGGGWISLAISSVARVPALVPSEEILDQFVPFTLDSAPTAFPQAPGHSNPAELSDYGLHERLYQSATSNWRRLGRGSEAFHEFSSPFDSSADSSPLHSSALGLWASGRQESGLGGVPARPRSFWLVADAELIVYGATDPQARLTIGSEDVPLSAEGTFRIQVPFRDGEQLYPIEACAGDGEQKRNITMQFQRTTPEENVNTAEEATNEWF